MLADSDEDDRLLEALEADDTLLNSLKEKHFATLRAAQKAESSSAEHYGTVEDLSSESQLMELSMTIKAPIIVHFYRRDFKRCQTMTEALGVLAGRYSRCKVVEVEATRAPFLTAKWAIRLLPCVVKIEGREAVDKVVGFEGVMVKDGEELDMLALEERLFK